MASRRVSNLVQKRFGGVVTMVFLLRLLQQQQISKALDVKRSMALIKKD